MAGKRGQNEGTIYRRVDGRWEAAVSLGNGKRKRLYAKTRAEASRKLAQTQHAVAQGLPVANDKLTVRQFLVRWLDSMKPNVRPRTYVSYEQTVRDYLIPELGNLRLSKLDPTDVERMMGSARLADKSPTTRAYARSVLRIALQRGLRWGTVARNVAALTDPPRVERAPIRPLSAEEARAFLEAGQGDRLEALFRLAITTGLRQGELLGLLWRDVDIDRGQITIRFQLQRVGGSLQLTEPKTVSSRRTLTLPQSTVSALREHGLRQVQERLVSGSKWQNSGLVFTTGNGTPIDPRNVQRSFKRILAAAGLPNVRFHDLRHSTATLLLSEGIQAKVVAAQLGHSATRTTLDVYSHVVPALQEDAARRLDAVLGADQG